MANRVLRDWTQSESIDKLSQGAEIFFTRLIMKADDYGCYYGNPKLLNSALFPLKDYESKQIIAWRDECAKANIIILYQVEGKDYIKIVDFGQRLRLMKSKFPQPEDGTLSNVSQTSVNGRPETKLNETETEGETNAPETFDEKFKQAFDGNTMSGYALAFRTVDLPTELKLFRLKCDNDKQTYYHRDSAGLRTAFQYQLKTARKIAPQKAEVTPVYKKGRAFGEGQ